MTPSATVISGQTGISASVNVVDPTHATSFVRRNLFSMSVSVGRLSITMKRFSPNSLQKQSMNVANSPSANETNARSHRYVAE